MKPRPFDYARPDTVDETAATSPVLRFITRLIAKRAGEPMKTSRS